MCDKSKPSFYHLATYFSTKISQKVDIYSMQKCLSANYYTMNLEVPNGAVLRLVCTAYSQGYPQVLGITLMAF